MKKVILVDGNSLMYRAYYATSESGYMMQNSKGLYTNAIFAFVKMIQQLKEMPHDYFMVAFDAGKKTFRHDICETYKDGRAPMPEELRMQIPHIKEFLTISNIKQYQLDLYEADDIIGTLSKEASNKNYEVNIYSSDKDLLQLIDSNTTVHLMKKGLSTIVDFNPESFKEHYGLNHEQFVDLKALMGDASDNLAGVPGVGEKTAVKLLQEYQSLEGIRANLANIKGKLGENLSTYFDDATQCYKLCQIDISAPLKISIEDAKAEAPVLQKIQDFFRYLEFYSLLEKKIPEHKSVDFSYTIIDNIYDLKKIMLDGSAFVFETLDNNYHKDELIAIGLKNKAGNFIILPEVLDMSIDFQLYLDSENQKKIFDLKKAKVILLNKGYDLSGVGYDMMLASYILQPNLKNYSFKTICDKFDYFNVEYEEVIYQKGARQMLPLADIIYQHITKKLVALVELEKPIVAKLKENKQYDLFMKMEIPLASVLAKMEHDGIKVDLKELDEQNKQALNEIKMLERQIYDLVGTFNISSPLQLQEVLFEKLQLTKTKKTKTGYSTDIDALNAIKDEHPIVPLIILYRQHTKLYSTYLEGLKPQIYPDGKIHTIFLQALTTTGRLSSIEPNMQNIPVRTEMGRQIRKIFIPDENQILLCCDYSQIELRVLAHMADVALLKKAFNQEEDIHTQTAKQIFHTDDVTPDLRRKAKAANFGIIYGISAFGLSDNLDIPQKEAKQFIEKYLEVYPEIKVFMDEQIEKAKETGYVETMSNRRRYINELASPIYMVKEMGKRNAMNAPIQGSAADIIKMAMIKIDADITKRKLKSRMLLQVHDELVFSIDPNEKDVMLEIVKNGMEKAFILSVPLSIDYGFGSNWLEAK